MDFAPFDTRGYPTLGVVDGYRQWAATYEATVLDLMDIRLLEHLTGVDWRAPRVLDLACGTGRIGAWLKARGAGVLTGLDLTDQMLVQAKARGVYDALALGDVSAVPMAAAAFELVTMSLADEHLSDLGPLYREAARLTTPGGAFVIAGFHPHFLMQGVVTHFDKAPGEPVAIESHVHLTSDHVAAAHAAGLRLIEMVEGVVDDAWIAAKPKWRVFAHHPVGFAMVWRKA